MRRVDFGWRGGRVGEAGLVGRGGRSCWVWGMEVGMLWRPM